MKRKLKIFSLLTGFMILMVSCNSIVDEKFLENTTTIEGVELVAIQNAAKGNLIELRMNTPGVTGYWDYNLGKALTDRVQFVYPIPGTSTFTFVGTLGAEFFEKTIDVQVDVLDTPLNQDWYDLVSENTAEGKTWVFAGAPRDQGLWWFMSPPDNPDSHMSVWWNAGGSGDMPPIDATGKMSFDLDGAANYTYYASADAEGEEGTFVLDVANQTLTVVGPNILGGGATPGYDIGSPAGTYQIMSLTEDELILYVNRNSWDTGWTWVFKPE
jgi:hypothetical protein